MDEDTATSNSIDFTIVTEEGNSQSVEGPGLLTLQPSVEQIESVQDAWYDYSDDLANWVYHHLLNRDDVYGAYLSLSRREGRSKNYTAPPDEGHRFPGVLTSYKIKRHFCGFDHGELIGIHAISTQITSLWFAIDIDQHSENAATAAATNFIAAEYWCRMLTGLGFHPLFMDSNGNGGLHVWVVLQEPVPTRVVYHFARWLVGNHLELGLPDAPETFPKQAKLSESCRYGNWLRLPGRHHTRDHWTTVWDQGQWLAGESAINHLLQATGDDVNILWRWLESHPLPTETLRPSVRKVVPTRRLQTSPVPVPESANPAVPAVMGFRLCLQTRSFLLGHFKNESQWNNRLFAAACDMAGNGFVLEEAIPQLLRGAAPYNSEESAAATRTIESAFSRSRQSAQSLSRNRSHIYTILLGDTPNTVTPDITPSISQPEDDSSCR